jgi:hypothetical protein
MLMIVPTINSYLSSESMLGLGDIGKNIYIYMYMYGLPMLMIVPTINSYLSSESMLGSGDIGNTCMLEQHRAYPGNSVYGCSHVVRSLVWSACHFIIFNRV